MSKISESAVEEYAIRLLERLGYEYNPNKVVEAYSTATNTNTVLMLDTLYTNLKRLNPDLSDKVLNEALYQLKNSQASDLINANKTFHQYLTAGISLDIHEQGETKGALVKVIDFDTPENNDFLVANQITYRQKNYTKRPDVILFINGIPLVVFELKNPINEQATLTTAYQQLENYKATISDLFIYNELLIISDGLDARAGSLSADFSRFMAWKTTDGKTEASHSIPQLEVLINGILNKTTLLDLIRHFTVFEETSTEDEQGIISKHVIKKIAAYHQYYAVNAAVANTLRATGINTAYTPKQQQLQLTTILQEAMSQQQGNRKAGVVWHTQGSGKSLSMVFYTGKVVLTMNNPTVVVLTDRNDLDDQLFETFAASKQLLRQTPVQAKNREHLKELLKVGSGGVIFTTIQKFSPEEGNVFDTLSERANIIVIADEAHRSQYGFKAKVREADQAIVYGYAKYLRDALPNATYLGFTGTPIEKGDVNTQAVFGHYIDIYDIAQAVEDGATVPIYYESRLAEITLTEEGKSLIKAFDQDTEDTEQATQTLVTLEDIIGNSDRIKHISKDIIAHFTARQDVFMGKGMIVCMSRPIAAKLYDEIIHLKPAWQGDGLDEGAIKVVFTSNSSDAPALVKHHTTTKQRRRLADRMKDPSDPLQMVIVCDMWLTGFDVPCLHTMYLDKPMKGHTLMQAIARVNRVYKDKPAGLIVDYLGIASDLKNALSFYSDAGGKGDPTLQQEQAIELMLAQLDVLEGLLHGFDYQRYFNLDTGGKLCFLLDVEEYLLDPQNNQGKGKERYLQAVTALSKAFAIAVPKPEALAIKDKVALFQQIKARLVKLTSEPTPHRSIDESTIKQMIDSALVVDKIIDIYDESKIKNPDISILSPEFLEEMKGYQHKNVAIETLKKIIAGDLKTRGKVNVVQSKSLMEMLETTINKYHNKILTAAQVIEELINLSKKVMDADHEADALKLTKYEYAFYTAVASNKSASELMQKDKLRELAVVLTQAIRENATIDWTKKESIQAKLRVVVKRLLKKYGYPPDMQALATETVLKQAELIADNLTDNIKG